MARAKKSWVVKLAAAKAKPDLPKVFFCNRSKQRLAVPAVGEVEDLMRGVRKGRLMTVGQVVENLREKHKADAACPMATGIFAWIVAHAAEEAREEGVRNIVPWWRLLKTGGELNPKYPGKGALQKERLEEEGHTVVAKGKSWRVEGYEGKLVKMA